VTPPPPLPPPKTPSPYETFVAGDYIFSPKVYNKFAPGNSGSGAYRIDGAIEFPLFGWP
jgi:hypothetical protein